MLVHPNRGFRKCPSLDKPEHFWTNLGIFLFSFSEKFLEINFLPPSAIFLAGVLLKVCDRDTTVTVNSCARHAVGGLFSPPCAGLTRCACIVVFPMIFGKKAIPKECMLFYCDQNGDNSSKQMCSCL
jgi:hypothetical protein